MRKKTNVFVFLFLCSVMIFSLSNCAEGEYKKEGGEEGEKPQKPVKPPKQIVSLKEAKMMYKMYTERRVPLIRHFEDSILHRKRSKDTFNIGRYVEYDYKTIKQYMEYIEQQAGNLKEDISTIRIYFVNYPDEAKFPNGDSIIHPGQNSVVIAPTIKRGKRDYLFYGIHEGGKNHKPVLLSNAFEFVKGQSGLGQIGQPEKNNASLFPSLNTAAKKPPIMFVDTTSMFLNRGNIAPPPY
ncbi:hypothetical protein [Spongiimicrobium salis]|uniref:hypothetical protein n=1 Tax=Spongiimicrobium salis TaxID=1667022 RepID=UPI00374DA5AF